MRRPTKESNIYAREYQSIYVFSLIIVFFFNIPESNIYGTSYKGIINEFNYSEEVALELWEEPDTNIHPNVKVSRLCCFSAHKFQWKWRRRNRISGQKQAANMLLSHWPSNNIQRMGLNCYSVSRPRLSNPSFVTADLLIETDSGIWYLKMVSHLTCPCASTFLGNRPYVPHCVAY